MMPVNHRSISFSLVSLFLVFFSFSPFFPFSLFPYFPLCIVSPLPIFFMYFFLFYLPSLFIFSFAFSKLTSWKILNFPLFYNHSALVSMPMVVVSPSDTLLPGAAGGGGEASQGGPFLSFRHPGLRPTRNVLFRRKHRCAATSIRGSNPSKPSIPAQGIFFA